MRTAWRHWLKPCRKEGSMRLEILNNGYKLGARLLFSIIKIVSGYPLPDAARLVFYRPDFYGTPAKAFTQRAMRGPSGWSVAERELMAAYVSKLNQCTFCVKAHSAVSAAAYGDNTKVESVLTDPGEAAITLPLRATLLMLGKLTRQGTVSADDVRKVIAVGVSTSQIEDALAVCFAFNVTNRLADTFDFFVPSDDAFKAGAKYLLKRGYSG
ncbi:carboxymuconolactone decarboxylase family protein [Mucilaginibacter sp. L3T2-6]|uniref:carboxymuconolactone decarboxylase family protein n=1 Tax=Mucilaginibacter sp. L3T2-6 TaxID=3062491 RepID=UPI002676F81E|nr:carboxymuconolactone decarboxylase family protein [Mucilaginibacter sp. L3T2-6]MDO3644639.1 carboxymuconolactone decarboxylase family protein [Mucilaginibacter sp. L3T2-6]MDV6217091.1 carboxymuconolactone decarboxylase family protein [Mucilaginibacter sp. L3T2-6]